MILRKRLQQLGKEPENIFGTLLRKQEADLFINCHTHEGYTLQEAEEYIIEHMCWRIVDGTSGVARTVQLFEGSPANAEAFCLEMEDGYPPVDFIRFDYQPMNFEQSEWLAEYQSAGKATTL